VTNKRGEQRPFALLGRIACMHDMRMRPIVTDILLAVCVLVTIVDPAKTDQPIEMPFQMWARGEKKNH